MSDKGRKLDPSHNKRNKMGPKKGNPEKLQARGRKFPNNNNDRKGRGSADQGFAEEEISNALESMRHVPESELSPKKYLTEDPDDTNDIQYLKEEYEEFKSLKNIFVNRKQFIHLAKINSPAYKIRMKEIEREKIKNSKSKFKKASITGVQKDSSYNKGIDTATDKAMDRSTINDDNATVGDIESSEDIDPRIFKVHGKTFRF